jgi:hypothetical protein
MDQETYGTVDTISVHDFEIPGNRWKFDLIRVDGTFSWPGVRCSIEHGGTDDLVSCSPL